LECLGLALTSRESMQGYQTYHSSIEGPLSSCTMPWHRAYTGMCALYQVLVT
jgi:hypothetical protein